MSNASATLQSLLNGSMRLHNMGADIDNDLDAIVRSIRGGEHETDPEEIVGMLWSWYDKVYDAFSIQAEYEREAGENLGYDEGYGQAQHDIAARALDGINRSTIDALEDAERVLDGGDAPMYPWRVKDTLRDVRDYLIEALQTDGFTSPRRT